jgi:hypothetical protein
MYIDFIRVYDQQNNLIFTDEFNGSKLDTAKWNIEENSTGADSQELQNYRRQNVHIGRDRASGKNCLVLSAKRE